jgi:uncharacterized protein
VPGHASPWPGARSCLTGNTGRVRITIWVRPGSPRPGVGGEHAGALVVRVSARAVDGQATEAALTAVARTFDVARSAVTLVTGASSRTKIIDVAGGDPALLTRLLGSPGSWP